MSGVSALQGEQSVGSGETGPLVVVCGLSFEAEIVQGTASATRIKTVCWAQADLLRQALIQAVEQGCRGILSFGTAGGLAPDLQPGEWVVADTIKTADRCFETHVIWSAALVQALGKVRRGRMLGVNQPIVSAADKQALYCQHSALAVDMESHIAAEVAEHYKIPFAVCRVVIDPARRTLPACALAGTQVDGSTRVAPILAALAAQPAQLPALLRLACDASKARKAMRAGRARLGPDLALL